MRLEGEHEAAARKARACRFERRAHLHGVVPVVIDQRERAAAVERNVAIRLEAAADAAKFRERLGDRAVGDSRFAADGDGVVCSTWWESGAGWQPWFGVRFGGERMSRINPPETGRENLVPGCRRVAPGA